MYVGGMPPECYSKVGVPESDLYQVGLTLYRAVNGDEYFHKQLPLSVGGSIDQLKLEQLTVKGKFPNVDLFMPHVPGTCEP